MTPCVGSIRRLKGHRKLQLELGNLGFRIQRFQGLQGLPCRFHRSELGFRGGGMVRVRVRGFRVGGGPVE